MGIARRVGSRSGVNGYLRAYAAGCVWLALVACQQPDATLWGTIDASNTQLAATATADIVPAQPTDTPTATATDTPTPTPTITPTPTSSIFEVTPCPANEICVIPDSDEDILARLCTVEVRGFGSKRRVACLSVVSTVLTRMAEGVYTDNTVEGTILYGCTPEQGCRHFPGFVVNGCEGIIAEACPWNYPADIAYFQAIAREGLNGVGHVSGSCTGYIYYGSRDIDMRADACIIEGDNGQREAFYN